MDLELRYHTPIRLKILMYLAQFPEGRQRSQIANELPVYRNDSLRIQQELFDEHLIEAEPSFDKHRFKLTKEGQNTLVLLKGIDVYIKQITNPDVILTDDEMYVFQMIETLAHEMIQKQTALRTAKKVEEL